MAGISSNALSDTSIEDALISRNDSDDDDFLFNSELSEEYSSNDSDSDDEPLDERVARIQQTCNRPNTIDAWVSGDFSPTLFPFIVQNSGINIATGITADSSELDCFRVFFNANMMDILVRETNRFFLYQRNLGPLQEKSKLHKWQDTDANELYVFFGIFMLMSLQKRPKISDYWSTDPLMNSPIFGKVMSSLRFRLLLRMLHFCNNESQGPNDKLFKIQSIISSLKDSFRNSFVPHQNVVIDESLVLWKGRLSFKQYIPSKRHRFGIKLFILCDCKSGYILDFIVYTGASTQITATDEGVGKSGAIVLTLMQPLLGKGHILFTDNWYTSPALAKKLFSENTGTCGTVRKNRKEMPVFPKKLKIGERVEKHNQNVLAVKWHDRRDVHLLSTVDEPGETESGKKDYATKQDILKPKCVIRYNQNMGAIDTSDMQLSFAECVRKSLKWYKKFFFHLLDLASLNAYIMYKVSRNAKREFGEFRLELVRQLIQEYHKPSKSPKGGRISAGETPLRLSERHFPALVPPTEKKVNPTRTCRVCAKTNLGIRKRKESRYMCQECDIALCVHPCFKAFHTQVQY